MFPKAPFDRVVLSTNDNPKYIQFWPLVAWHWKRIYNVPVTLAVLSVDPKLDVIEMARHGDIVRLAPEPSLPSANQAKMVRLYVAANNADPNEIILINDVDQLQFHRDYLVELLKHRPPGHLAAIGAELYSGAEAGKFPMGNMTAEAHVFRDLYMPTPMNFSDWAKSFVGLKVFDHKEDISRDVHHENPETFSDESVTRALLSKRNIPVYHRRRGFYPYTTRAFCRSDWKFDQAKLENGTIVEAHMPRPYADHVDKIEPIKKWIERTYPESPLEIAQKLKNSAR